ncbi:hypothetical protein GCM10007973_05180 [Polymorphobacter multimanifer]|uniref:Uncharacterized protein n=1 Tax=Polymorphobacter multimanifer TaxID=1070431 RepID=A0A841L244_9SPHN|nr:hypothetical protein [Polymorphobacter multimanifer]MBB6226727.1 hypothetical protein [Polymorphobacter multimanifer]GGI71152.1 hypothetical protein GCM10007973_05180 [Polymorphobacter multimanifer]
MKRYILPLLVAALAVQSAQAGAQMGPQARKAASGPATTLSPEQAADRQVWIDEHARWNAEHMAAARRLEEVAASLKRHDTGFDQHGQELRVHGTDTAGAGAVLQAHPRLRTAHEQARNVHDDLMDAVDVLTRVLRKNLGKNQSFPPAPERP